MRLPRVAAAAAIAISAGLIGAGHGGPAAAAPAAAAPATAAPASGAPFTATKTVTRSFVGADGAAQSMSSKTVHVTVSQTTRLRGRQDINVSWSGAQPTGGVQPDLNGVAADQQEYPVMLVECRGVDSASAPAAKRVSPTTCWTHGSDARYQGFYSLPAASWLFDRYASAADRAPVVGRPANPGSACVGKPTYERWVPYVAAGGATYNYGNLSCAGLPPEDFNFDTSAQVVPQNATFAPTNIDGTGSVKFDVWTAAENASLGCSATVACTLEVIPIMGISCDPYGTAPGVPAATVPGPDDIDAAVRNCESTGSYSVGEAARSSQAPDLAVSGQLWWSASNWRNRIAVPLSFAPVSDACSQVGGGAPVSVYGSELMNEATAQWAPRFCLDPKLFKFTHVQTAEPLAQSLLNDPGSGVHAAFASTPPETPFAQPTVQAPVGMTGFSISYNIDGADGHSVDNLRLTPRLLAKLLTESYPGDDFDRFVPGQFGSKNPDGSPGSGIHGNPINITRDPEFRALNPGITAGQGLAGPATLIALSAESDVTEAVTAYINADPEARAWLDGKPDPWGMVVNRNYKGIKLPVKRWPLLDTTLPDFGQQVLCTQYDPAPWLPLVSSPTATLATTTLDVQFAASPGKTACGTIGDPNDPSNLLYQWTTVGRQFPGQRFVIGITSLGEAARYDLESAALQSTADVADPTAKFTDGSGRTFVRPTVSALEAAAQHVHKDAAGKVWTVSATALRTDKDAYPGLMIVDADVPTSGLSASDARDYSQLLDFAAGAGQVEGDGNGQLPPGYLPITSAHHLGALAAYTRRAAAAVRAQSGTVPALDAPPASPGGGTGGGNGTTSTGGTGSAGGGPGTGPGSTTGGPGSKPASGTNAPAGGGTASGGSPVQAALTVRTPRTGLGVAEVVLPGILGLGLLAGLVAGSAVFAPRRRK